jgi:hypothetical protein
LATGQINVDQFSDTLISTGIMQYAGARIMQSQGVGMTPIRLSNPLPAVLDIFQETGTSPSPNTPFLGSTGATTLDSTLTSLQMETALQRVQFEVQNGLSPGALSGYPTVPSVGGFANAAALDYAASLRASGIFPATAGVAYDSMTGAMVPTTSGPIPIDVNPVLVPLANQIGGLGARTACGNVVGTCFEFRGANQLLNEGSQLGNIGFSYAIRPRKMIIIPQCDNCTGMFGPGK